MARIDKLKEEIGWLKVIFAILLATDISLIAWLVQNYGKVNPFLFIIGAFAAILLTFLNVLINSIAYRKIDELEE
jgi:4-hydroxybenzoate polyprenyltransferase